MLSYTYLQPINCKININSFLHGIARIFDFVQVIDVPSNKTPIEVDLDSLRRDWEVIGMDMNTAMKQVEMELDIVKEKKRP